MSLLNDLVETINQSNNDQDERNDDVEDAIKYSNDFIVLNDAFESSIRLYDSKMNQLFHRFMNS